MGQLAGGYLPAKRETSGLKGWLQWLRAFVVFRENPGSITSVQMMAHNSSSRGSDTASDRDRFQAYTRHPYVHLGKSLQV
jgi:hypothetical protein